MLPIKEAKAQARILRTFLAEHQVTMPHGVMLEAIARLQHQKNWATYLAQVGDDALAVERHKVANWPVFVFYFQYDEATGDEYLSVLPGGTRLDDKDRTRYGQVLTHDGQRVPEGFALGAGTVAFDVQATVPAIDKYGLPWFADQKTAAAGFRSELGCAAVEDIEVNVRDTGDDSAENFWFEAFVNPELAKQLPQLSAEQREDQLTQLAYTAVFNRVFTDLGESSVEQVMNALQNRPRGDVSNRTAESYLQRAVDANITLNGPYDRLAIGELFGRLKALAKIEYEKLLARK